MFGTGIGVTQGDPVSPTILNILVNSVVRVVMLEVCRPQEAHHGLCWWVGEHNSILYVYDGRIAERNLVWVHMTLTAVVRMFESVGLITNLGKTKTMVSTPGFVWVKHGTAAYKRRVTRGGGQVSGEKENQGWLQ